MRLRTKEEKIHLRERATKLMLSGELNTVTISKRLDCSVAWLYDLKRELKDKGLINKEVR